MEHFPNRYINLRIDLLPEIPFVIVWELGGTGKHLRPPTLIHVDALLQLRRRQTLERFTSGEAVPRTGDPYVFEMNAVNGDVPFDRTASASPKRHDPWT